MYLTTPNYVVFGTEEEEEVDELQAELNNSQLSEAPNNSQISDSASSVTSSAQKRRVETVQIRTPRRRRGGGNMDGVNDYLQFLSVQRAEEQKGRRIGRSVGGRI